MTDARFTLSTSSPAVTELDMAELDQVAGGGGYKLQDVLVSSYSNGGPGVAQAQFNPKELTIDQSVPWK